MVKNKNLTVRFLQIKGGYVVAYVIGDYNRKGGVGKTSSIINIACQMALEGKRVLLIDGDSQMNLSQFFSRKMIQYLIRIPGKSGRVLIHYMKLWKRI